MSGKAPFSKTDYLLTAAAFVGITILLVVLLAPSNQPNASSSNQTTSVFSPIVASTTTISATASSSGTLAPPGCVLLSNVTSAIENVTLDVYASPHPTVGDDVCLAAQIVGPPRITFVEFTVVNSTGTVYFQQTFKPATGAEFGLVVTSWPTDQAFDGLTPVAGQYLLFATIYPYYPGVGATDLYNDTSVPLTLG